MFYVYILYSKTLDRFYVGQTESLDNRIFRHTNSGSKSTKAADDWELKYKEEFNTRSQAVQREAEIKKKKSRKYIEWLISSAKRWTEINEKHKNLYHLKPKFLQVI